MRLTQFSDYALRLMMLSASNPDRLVTIEETANLFEISQAHLMKIANQLTKSGFLIAVRGRHGGLRLALPANHINLGDLIRATEPDFQMAECFSQQNNNCRLAANCKLKSIISNALKAFFDVMDKHYLSELVLNPADFGMQSYAGNK